MQDKKMRPLKVLDKNPRWAKNIATLNSILFIVFSWIVARENFLQKQFFTEEKSNEGENGDRIFFFKWVILFHLF